MLARFHVPSFRDRRLLLSWRRSRTVFPLQLKETIHNKRRCLKMDPSTKIGSAVLDDGAEINTFDAASPKLFVVSGDFEV
ncbi:MAG: hypothetical protein AAFY20_14525 [Cyanobacteria bacterium J06639_14]